MAARRLGRRGPTPTAPASHTLVCGRRRDPHRHRGFAWRGYLTPRLDSLRIGDGLLYLIVGLVWGLWHLPYYLFLFDERLMPNALDVPKIVFALLAVIVLTGWSVVLVELFRLSGSVWPPLLLHTVHNSFVDPITSENTQLSRQAFVSQTEGVDRRQHLTVVGRLFPAILDGSKTSTIRWNESPIRPGLMTYVSDVPPHISVEVMVTACTGMPLSKVAEFLGRETEWPDAVMLIGMREHYADIELTHTVEVIEHLTPQQTQDRARSGR